MNELTFFTVVVFNLNKFLTIDFNKQKIGPFGNFSIGIGIGIGIGISIPI